MSRVWTTQACRVNCTKRAQTLKSMMQHSVSCLASLHGDHLQTYLHGSHQQTETGPQPAWAFLILELRVPISFSLAWLQSCDRPDDSLHIRGTRLMAGACPRPRGSQVVGFSVSLGAGCSPSRQLERRKEDGDLEEESQLFGVTLNTVSVLTSGIGVCGTCHLIALLPRDLGLGTWRNAGLQNPSVSCTQRVHSAKQKHG